MILSNETYEKFGYYPSNLKLKSHKKILAECNDCGKIRILPKYGYKDLCISCTLKKIERAEERNLHISQSLKGKTFSEERKHNQSVAHKGQHSSPNTEFKNGNVPWNLGISPSDETKQRISKSVIAKNIKGENHPFYGKHHTEQSKQKMSEANSGINHPQWRGGISFEPYCFKFNEDFKETIREQFNRKCFICNKSETENKEKLSVHHVNYNKNCLCDDSKCKFVPLCRSCHAKTTNNRQYWKEYFQSKILEFNNK